MHKGQFEILSEDNYWRIYGQTKGKWLIVSLYFNDFIGLASGPSCELLGCRGFTLKSIGPSHSAPIDINCNAKPTFSEFLHATKGQFKGIKRRGNYMKAAAIEYHKLYE